MPEAPVSSVTERSSLASVESLKGLGRVDCLRLSLMLTARLAKAGSGVLKTNDDVLQDEQYLKAKLAATKERKVDLNDPDELWRATHIIYPNKKEAEFAYQTIRISEITLLNGTVPEGWDSKRIHQELINNQWIVDQLNSRQIINGQSASLTLLNQAIQTLKAEKTSYGKTRRKFFQVAALGTAALTAKLISDRLPAEAQTDEVPTPPDIKPQSVASRTSVPTTPSATPKTSEKELEEKGIEGERILEDNILPGLTEEAQRLRAERKKNDPEWSKRINEGISKGNINFLFLGMGSEQDAQLTDTIMLISIDENCVARTIQIPRDLWTPEIDRFLRQNGHKDASFNAINTAYDSGGYDLIRKIVEDATGLPVDFITRLSIRGLLDVYNAVFGKIKVHMDQPLEDEFLKLKIPAGEQWLDAEQFYGYIASRRSTSEDARVIRQHQMIEILSNTLQERWNSTPDLEKPIFLGKIGWALLDLQRKEHLNADSDMNRFIIGKIFEMSKGFLAAKIRGKNLTLDKPEIKPLTFPDGQGTTWAPKEATKHRPHLKIVQKGDPYSEDLIEDYWKTYRDLVVKHFAA